jgi:hypothetical protein
MHQTSSTITAPSASNHAMSVATEAPPAKEARKPRKARKSASSMRPGMRRAHSIMGLILCCNLLLIVLTGLMVQHRDLLGLEDHYVSRRLLPSEYRSTDGSEVRMDIVVTDLHSGRMFGPWGAVAVDVIAVAALLLALSGVVTYAITARGRMR